MKNIIKPIEWNKTHPDTKSDSYYFSPKGGILEDGITMEIIPTYDNNRELAGYEFAIQIDVDGIILESSYNSKTFYDLKECMASAEKAYETIITTILDKYLVDKFYIDTRFNNSKKLKIDNFIRDRFYSYACRENFIVIEDEIGVKIIEQSKYYTDTILGHIVIGGAETIEKAEKILESYKKQVG